jgi:class 3 adenylate cyclase/tetratricopeptide (TPR) repeat protein
VTGDDPTLNCPACGASNQPGSRFCSSCATPLGAEPAAETRKTVTVLFCDATSSTALGERLDPESLRSVMTRYFDVMREVIEFHGGVVEKFIGDAVMAVFGVPTIHEDDALRACRAAIEIHDRLGELDEAIRSERGASVEWRMGINTGEVVAGDAVSGQRIVTGDAVNVAARLEGAASPGEILLGADTHALVREDVTAEPVEALSLKGKAEPVPAWRLTAVGGSVGRRVRPLEAPLVGRKRPLRLLEDAFREAVEERVCHLLTILGVAGVGKSRLVDEFVGSLGEQAQVATGRCLAYGHGITYWPVTEAIRGGGAIHEDAAPDVAMARIREVLSDEPEADRVVPVIGHLLGATEALPAPDEMFWAIRKTFEAMARDRPLVLVFDDIHWGEPTFLDLIDHVADWTRDAPILLIAMARPDLLEMRPTWGGGKRWVTTMQLEALSADESNELVGGLLGQADLPADVRAQIGQAAEGNPLFVEELLGKLIDDGFLVQSGDGWAAHGNVSELAIPPTIHALLAARLDGLASEDRAVIERASVEGKIFHRGAVTELAPELMRPHVRERLAGLMRMELVRPDQASFAGDEAYRFRHLLIRDAAYQALAKQTRSELHERFAAWLERVAADRLSEYEEIIAYHVEQAYRYRVELGPPDAHARELALRAGTQLADAGERADARSDVAAAVDLLGRAVDLLNDDLPRRRRVLITLADNCYNAGDGPRAERLLADAIADAEQADDEGAAALAAVALVMIQMSTKSTEMSVVLRELERLIAVLERLGATADARLAEAWSAFCLFGVGRAGEAAERARSLVELGEGGERWQREARMAMGVSLVFGPTPADEVIAELQAVRERAGTKSLAEPPFRGIGRMKLLQGRIDEAHELNARVQAVCEEIGNRQQLASCLDFEGQVQRLAGNLDEAARLSREGYQAMAAIGDRSFASTIAVNLGEILIDLGQDDEAWRFGAIARDTSSSDDVVSQAGGRAVQARVLSRRGEHAVAEGLAREAADIMSNTDYFDQHAGVLVHLAHVLREADKSGDALVAAREALSLYELKGATFFVHQSQRLIDEWVG